MDLLNASQIKNEGWKVIGLRKEDMERLIKAMEAKVESSFTVQSPEVFDEVSSFAPEVTVEPVTVEGAVYQEQPVLEEISIQPEVQSQTNIFDQDVPTFVDNTLETGSAPVVEATQEEFITPVQPVYTEPVPFNDEVQGGIQNTVQSDLDTPQTFFDRIQEEEVKSTVNNNVSEDPAIIMLDNLRKVVEDKNAMIKVLNEKVSVLEHQLGVSEEARKVLEAQRDAAQTTLEQARQAQEGPVLTYQQPNNVYREAA